MKDYKYTPVSNEVLDYVMVDISASAWKVLCVVLRQTVGWADKNSPTGRRQRDVISYSQFVEKSGISSETTISKAISELLARGYIERYQVGKARGSKKASFAYQVNTVFIAKNGLEDQVTTTENGVVTTTENGVEDQVTTTENGVVTTTENGVVTTTENGDTKERKKQTKVVDVDFSSLNQQSEILSRLAAVGVPDGTAKYLSKRCSLEDVQDWVTFAHSLGNVKDLASFVVNQLETGKKVPQGKLFK